jgi:hypothetical protein
LMVTALAMDELLMSGIGKPARHQARIWPAT